MIKKLYKKLTGNTISHEIPNSYIIFYFIKKFFSLINGCFRTFKIKVFVGKKVRFLCKKKIFFGKWININHDVYLDAMSINGIVLGDFTSIGCFTRIECTGSLIGIGQGFKCGNNCGLGTNCFYGATGGIELGNNVIVGNYVTFHSENHNYSNKNIPIRLQGVSHKGIKIGDDCWIGAKVTVLDGTEIGNGCVIAAGAVVTGKFPDNVVIGGVPAKIIKSRIDDCN